MVHSDTAQYLLNYEFAKAKFIQIDCYTES